MVKYKIEYSAANGQQLTCEGNLDLRFPDCLDAAMRDSFQQITQGKAVFGNPGVGCRGPYKINRFLIESVTH